jgi:hypothetical protein
VSDPNEPFHFKRKHNMSHKHSLTFASLLLTSSGLVQADGVNGPNPYAAGYGFDTPSEANWGGWNRGDAGTIYAEWDSFSDASHGTATDRTAAPGVGSSGATGPYLSWNAGTFAAGSGNLYSFSVPEVFQVNLSGTTGSAPLRVALQVEDWGTPLDTANVRLNGVAPTSSRVTYFESPYVSSFGPVDLNQRLFLWDLPSASTSFQFDFSSVEHSLSLAQVAVDIGSVPVSAVPVPAAVWLFGSALAGMGIIGRRRQPGKLAA